MVDEVGPECAPKAEREERMGLGELHRLCLVALMAAVITAGALFNVSIGPVPITFQDFFVAFSGLVLGPRYGAAAVLLYLFAGAVGLPVFSGGRAGLGHFAGPTGGYLLGFVLLAVCCGLGTRCAVTGAAEKKALSFMRLVVVFAFAFAGLGLLYLLGVSGIMFFMNVPLEQAIAVGVLPFLPVGPAKVACAVLLWRVLYARNSLPGLTR